LRIGRSKGGEKLPRYETVFVLDPSLDEKAVANEIEKIEALIRDHNGQVLKIDKWGKRRFAYPIKKKHEGFYTLILFEGEGGIPKELGRTYELNELCLRYLTVVAQEEAEPVISAGKEKEVTKRQAE
jgi:small subunit ribosomal protein S6